MADRWVAFLRAVNVGGHGLVTMEALRSALERRGLSRVRTWIQTGNVLFDAPGRSREVLARELEREVGRLTGEESVACLRTLAELRRLARLDPFAAWRGRRGAALYVSFLRQAPARARPGPDADEKDGLEVVGRRGLDVFVVSRPVKGRRGFPNLMVERAFGVPGTSRNWNTVQAILELE